MGFLKKFGGLLAGVAAGFLFGPGAFSALAFSIGSTIGGFLFGPKPPKPQPEEAFAQTSEYGQFIPRTYGTFCLAGNIVDGPEDGALDVRIGKSGAQRHHFTGLIVFCEGAAPGAPEKRIDKIWGNDVVVYDRNGATAAEKGYTLTYDADTGEEYSLPAGGGTTGGSFWEEVVGNLTTSEQINGLWLYRGTETQKPNPWMQALHGGKAPAYRGLVAMALYRHMFKPYDEAFPTFRALIVDTQTNVGEIITGHLARGLDYETEAVPEDALDVEISDTVTGCAQLQREAPIELCNKLAAFAFSDLVEVGGKIRASDRRDPVIHILDEDELAAHMDDDDAPPVLKTTVATSLELPGRLSAKFYDVDLDYQQNTAPAARQVQSNATLQSVDLPIVSTLTDMQRFAQMALDEVWAARTPYELSLPPGRIGVAPGDVLRVPRPADAFGDGGEYTDVRVAEQVMGAPGPILITGNSWSAIPYVQPQSVTQPERPSSGVGVFGDLSLLFIDSNAMEDSDLTYPGWYVGMAVPSGKLWPRPEFKAQTASEVVSTSEAFDGAPWSPATCGTAVNALGADAGIFDVDVTNTLTVDLLRGALVSATDADLDAGANRAWIESADGWEIIQFKTATVVGTVGGKMRYVLSNIRRGMRGTDAFIAGHDAGDNFVLYDDAIKRADIQLAQLDRELSFVVDYDSNNASNTTTVQHTAGGANLVPYSGINISGTVSGGDWLIDWVPRSRQGSAWWQTGQDPPVLEPSERYEVDILDGVTVKRTLQVNTSSATYTSAQQTSDFGAPQTEITVRVYQIGALGRGYVSEATLIS